MLFRAARALGVAAATAGDVIGALRWALKQVFTGDDDEGTCEVKTPPFFLGSTFLLLLAIPVFLGKTFADGDTPEPRWVFLYMAAPFGTALLAQSALAWWLYPRWCAHCAYAGCTVCSAGTTPPTRARTRRSLSRQLAAAGWYTAWGLQQEFCPAHADLGRATELRAENSSSDMDDMPHADTFTGDAPVGVRGDGVVVTQQKIPQQPGPRD